MDDASLSVLDAVLGGSRFWFQGIGVALVVEAAMGGGMVLLCRIRRRRRGGRHQIRPQQFSPAPPAPPHPLPLVTTYLTNPNRWLSWGHERREQQSADARPSRPLLLES